MEKKNKSTVVVLVIAAALLIVLLLDIWRVFRLTSDLTRNGGQYHLESISGELEEKISDAKILAMELSISASPYLDDQRQLESFIYRNKQEVVEKNIGCFNVYMAGSDWSVIPDFDDKPDDYVAAQRDWYKGAKRSYPSAYVTAPYVDAMTRNICYTVAVMLGDRDTVLALDYTMDNIQSTIESMYDGSSKYALIVTGDGVIAGCSQEEFIGRSIADVLPDYTSIFALVKSANTFVTTRIKSGLYYENLFATASGFGWYLIVSENDWTLYKDAYAQLITGAIIALLLTVIIIAMFLISQRRQQRMAQEFKEQHTLISRISAQLVGPLNTIINESNQDQHDYHLAMLKTAGRQILDTLNNVQYVEENDRGKRQRSGNEQSLSVNKRFRTRILLLIGLVIVVATSSNLWISMRWGNEKIKSEVNNYEYTLSEWVSQQKSILDMFCSVISINPEILDDYEKTIAYLDRITRQYPDISASYMSNPEREPSVYMNNGWLPPEGWHVEERQWYIDTLNAESGWTISTPYYDEQTGLYCVTFSERVYDNETREFLGNFGIDFFMDKLIDIMGGSYSDTGYAFLADTDGVIINHPYGSYQMTENKATNVSEVKYGQVKPDGLSSIVIRDYDGALRIITSKRNTLSRFTVYEATSFSSIYATTIIFMTIVVSGLLLMAIMVYRLLTGLIHWQSEMNDKMQKAADTAIAAGNAKSRFLAQMSHEIRTPINAVLGMNEMILRGTNDVHILDYAANIQNAGRTLLSLINSILDFSKIEEGKMEIVSVVYDTSSFITGIVSSISERARGKGLEFIVDVDASLPSQLTGDDLRLAQIIMNLLTNAVKYTERGFVCFRLHSGKRQDDLIEISASIEDSGIGIKKEDMARLFESFERLDEVRNHNIEGTGLGMSIVTGLLKMMDSHLTVESEYGKGSIFSFTVMQKIADETPIGDSLSHHEHHRETVKESLYAPLARILIVDDNDINMKVARNLLSLFAITPDEATSGFEAIDKIRHNDYNLIFLDHMMPKMDGIETLKELKKEQLLKDDTRVVVLTANAVIGARELYLTAGFDDYLSKPIDVDKLESMLKKYLPPSLCSLKNEAKKDTSTGNPVIKEMETAGFDTADGIRYAAGDETFYLDLVKGFMEKGEENISKIQQDYERKDWKDYQIHAHTVKSSARQIGANKLADIAMQCH